jgi:hypothetical protein
MSKILTITPLLFALFTMSCLTVIAKPGAIIYVEEGDSIQDAVDAATPGDTILVGPGEYEGEIFIAKQLTLIGDGAKITSGFAGFILFFGSDGTVIRGFAILDLFLGIWALHDDGLGLDVDNVEIRDNYIRDSTQAITNTRGDNWIIKKNTIDGLVSYFDPPFTVIPGIGISLGGSNHFVVNNDIRHVSEGGIAYFGMVLGSTEISPLTNCKILANRVTVYAPEAWVSIGMVIEDWSVTEGGGPITMTDNLIVGNHLRGSFVKLYIAPLELFEYNTIKDNAS